MRYIALDTETWAFWPGCMAPPLVCASVCDRRPNLLNKARALEWCELALRNSNVTLIGQNIAYDLGVICAERPRLLPLVFAKLAADLVSDTAIRESIILIEEGHLADEGGSRASLADLALKYFGVELEKEDTWRKRYKELDGTPLHKWPKEAREYPKSDAYWTKRVWNAQKAHPSESHFVRTAFSLHLQTLWGLRTERNTVEALAAGIEENEAKMQKLFSEVGIRRPDGTEDQKMLRQLVTDAYLNDPPLTPKGAVAIDRDTKLESGSELLKQHALSGKNNKYRTTYLPKLKEGLNAPINPKYYGMAATTRVTSDYQQLPQKGGVREAHRARPGFVFCSVDYEGLELRTMAQRCLWEPGVKFSDMATALLRGDDPHTLVASTFLRRPYNEILPLIKSDPVVKGMRDLGKVENFGKGGGMGDNTLVYQARAKDGTRFCLLAGHALCGTDGFIKIRVQGKEKRICRNCSKIAKDLGQGWLKTWPEQQKLFDKASWLHKNGARSTVTIPHLNIKRGNCGYTQWLNTPFQALGAIMCTTAMWRITEEMYNDRTSPLFGCRLVLMVHDELVAELRNDSNVSEAADRMSFLQCSVAKSIIPDLAPAVRAEPALSYILSKDAKTIRDAQGKLQIWEPG